MPWEGRLNHSRGQAPRIERRRNPKAHRKNISLFSLRQALQVSIQHFFHTFVDQASDVQPAADRGDQSLRFL